MPASFTSGPFKGHKDQAGEEAAHQDQAQIQSLIEDAFNKGLDHGRAEMSASQDEQIKSAVTAFEAGIKEMHRIRQHDVERMEAEIVRLALSIAKKIIGYETKHSQVIQHVVKQAMEKVNDTRQLIIKLNPKDLDAVQLLKADLLPEDDLGANFRIEADEGIKRGGCIIETQLGDIDARIDQQLNIIEALLVDQIPKPVTL